MKRLILAALTVLAPTTALADPASGGMDLRLVCRGVGDHRVEQFSSGTIFGRHGSAGIFGSSTQQSQFGDQMDVEITGKAGKARVPRRFLPPAHGGDGGWFEIKDLVIGEDTITGTVLINFINHPKLRLDRRTGAINLDGKVGAYAGECERYDPASEKRAF